MASGSGRFTRIEWQWSLDAIVPRQAGQALSTRHGPPLFGAQRPTPVWRCVGRHRQDEHVDQNIPYQSALHQSAASSASANAFCKTSFLGFPGASSPPRTPPITTVHYYSQVTDWLISVQRFLIGSEMEVYFRSMLLQ